MSHFVIAAFKMFFLCLAFSSLLWCVDVFVFIKLRVWWASLMCTLMVSNKLRMFSGIISLNIYSVFFFFYSLLLELQLQVYLCASWNPTDFWDFFHFSSIFSNCSLNWIICLPTFHSCFYLVLYYLICYQTHLVKLLFKSLYF